MSLGENKGKIIAQFFTELLVVMIVSVGIASVTGNFIGNAVGNQLLTQQNQTQQEQTSTQTNGGADGGIMAQAGGAPTGAPGGGRMSGGFGSPFASRNQEEQIKSMNVKMTPSSIGFLALIALGIVVLAIFLASIGILRMQPKAILTSN